MLSNHTCLALPFSPDSLLNSDIRGHGSETVDRSMVRTVEKEGGSKPSVTSALGQLETLQRHTLHSGMSTE